MSSASARCPARVVMYCLLAMVLFFQSGYGEDVEQAASRAWTGPGGSRCRLLAGMQPSAARRSRWRVSGCGWQVMAAAAGGGGRAAGRGGAGAARCVAGMRLAAVDGMCLGCPASPENGAGFGYPATTRALARSRRSASSGLGSAGPGRCWARRCRRWPPGATAAPPAPGEAPPGDLLLADRNFLSHGLLKDVLDAGVHVLWRAKSDVDLPVLEVLADGTWLSRIADPAASRRMRRKGACRRRHSRHHRPRHRILGDLRGRQRGLGALHPGHRPARSRAAGPGAGRGRLCLPLAAGNLLRWSCETSIRGERRRGAALEVPAHDPPGDLRDALLLPGDPAERTLISRAAGGRRTRPRQDLLHPRPRRESAAASRRAPVAFPPTALATSPPTWSSRSPSPATSVPQRPGRRYERKTRRPGGRYKTRKPGEPARLTPLTRVVFWLDVPMPGLTECHWPLPGIGYLM